MMKDGLKLFFKVLLTAKLSFVVDLGSGLSDFNTFFNEFVLKFISFLERTDVLALYVLLVVHDHLVVLKKMKEELRSYKTAPLYVRPHVQVSAFHYKAFFILIVSFFPTICTGSFVALLHQVVVGKSFYRRATILVLGAGIVCCGYGIMAIKYLNYSWCMSSESIGVRCSRLDGLFIVKFIYFSYL
jgi:hypothetical protein